MDKKKQKICSEIPFYQVKGSKMIFGTLGLMVFLITLCLSGSVILERTLQAWQQEVHHGFTVTLPPASDPQNQFLQQIDLITVLKQVPGVLNVEIVTLAGRSSIFDSWSHPLSSSSYTEGHQFIDVKVDERTKIDLNYIKSNLELTFPEIKLEPGRKAKNQLLSLAHLAQIAAICLAGLIGAAAVFTIAFTTHTGLVIHERVIEVLRLIGAEDRFIAKQFQNYALNLALKGGIIGIALSSLFFYILTSNVNLPDFTLAVRSLLSLEIWGIIFIAPLLVACIIMASARTTVMFSLSQEA